MNKRGRSKAEDPIIVVGSLFITIFFIMTIFSTGVASIIMSSFTEVFGFLGMLLGLFFIIAISAAVYENFGGKR